MTEDMRWIEDVGLTVTFDNSLGEWLVVRSDGSIVMSGFTSNRLAWEWIDRHEDLRRDLIRSR
jgi:hypothetical protein